MDLLLSRNSFRESVFKRDSFKCVNCKAPAQDAHHILERRLWPDGGYYLNNGASVCGDCHMLCEQTILTVEEVREKAGIEKPIIPPHFYRDVRYDKWGNVYLENGRRTPGELFYDESVQKVLRPVLDQFDSFVKYPRTYHLPWSPGLTRDDRMIESADIFKEREVVVTIKMDGENTTMYHDYIHARSIDSGSHPSRTWVKNFHAKIAHEIPAGWRLCGENLFAKHSIAYDRLPAYFTLFSIWEQNRCFSWQETKEYADLLEIKMVPTLWEGVFNEKEIRAAWEPIKDENEGYVVRVKDSFEYKDFRTSVAKFVRKGHVETTHHWMAQAVVPNKLE